MVYNELCGEKVSALGFGTMRLPDNGKYEDINIPAATEMFGEAIDAGVNYFDTAYGYHGGKSETAVGEILSSYPREKYFLATKFPGYDKENFGKYKDIFEEQLKKCRVEYFDFYLLHTVTSGNIDDYLNTENGLIAYLREQKKEGRIRHLGFSAHCSTEVLSRLLDALGDAVEFGQLQVNYLDWNYQNAKAKTELLASYGVPVITMESLRGGKLARVGDFCKAEIEKTAGCTPQELAFRFLRNIKGVKVALSGMSDLNQVRGNIRIFENIKPLSNDLFDFAVRLGDGMAANKILPCTACKYCVPKCPAGLDIPSLVARYNKRDASDTSFSECLGCKNCESVCPQEIKISEMMADFENIE